MYNIGNIFQAKLSLTWDAIIGLITLLGTFWGVYKIIGSKVSKRRYYEDLKEIREEMNKLEKEFDDKLDCFKQENMGSHGKLSAEAEKYFEILKDEMQRTFGSVEKKLDMLLEHAINDKK